MPSTTTPAPRLFALVPAHNEAAGIAACLESLATQDRRPDRVIVVADNCTDDTAAIATRCGAEVFHTTGNSDKKAGALNQALELLLPDLEAQDAILVLDADTMLSPQFTSVSLDRLDADLTIGAVGGIFRGQDPRSSLEQAQANEYVRYAREVHRTGRVMVLTGTSSVFRVAALRQVAQARGGRTISGRTISGPHGRVYNPAAITEDMEVTLALRHLGWRLVSPSACQSFTELMPTVADLHRQRVRWYRGALDNLRDYGLTSITRRYWGQQVGILLGTLTFALYVGLIVLDAVLGLLTFNPWWACVGLVFLADRLVTVWGAGRRGRLLAALAVPEILYDLTLQYAFLTAVREHLARRETQWDFNLNHTSTTATEKSSHV